MANPDRLFELIVSLSKGEKLNFKKFASKHIIKGGNSYVKLFDAICKLSKKGVYDESAIKDHFRGERFINNFSVMKSYLYENILKSLGAVQNDDAYTLFRNAGILHSRGLNLQVPPLIRKAKKAAARNEDYGIMLSILELEYNFTVLIYTENQKEKLNRIIKEKKDALGKFDNLVEYRSCLLEIPYFNSKEVLIRSEKEKTRLKNLIKNNPLLSKDRTLTGRARLLYLLTKGMSYYSLGNFQAAYKYYQRLILLIESTYCLRKRIDNYALILYNFMYMALLLRKFEDVPGLLVKFENLLKQKASGLASAYRIRAFFFYYLVRLDLAIYTADFERYSSVFKETEDFINTNSSKGFADFPHLIFTLATAYFAKGDYGKALLWINEFFNEKDYKSFSDIAVGEKILSIFIHYELNNIELLQYVVKSLYHYLLKGEKTYRFEKSLIRFIRRLPNIRSNEDFIVNLKMLKKELIVIRKDPFESRVFFEYFDYIAWIDSKIENKPLAEVLKSRGSR